MRAPRDTFPRTAVYPGIFDPPLKGHRCSQRATGLFDRVVVGIGRNPEKDSLFAEERVELDGQCDPKALIMVEAYEKDRRWTFAKKHRAVASIRGFRTMSDVERMPIGYRQPHRGRLETAPHGRGSRARLHQQSFDSRSRRPRRRLGSPCVRLCPRRSLTACPRNKPNCNNEWKAHDSTPQLISFGLALGQLVVERTACGPNRPPRHQQARSFR